MTSNATPQDQDAPAGERPVNEQATTHEQSTAQEPAPAQEPKQESGQTPERAPEQADPERSEASVEAPTAEIPRSEMPTTEDLQEPSTEKTLREAPKAPKREEREPDHEAVGIGVIGRPQTDPDDTTPG